MACSLVRTAQSLLRRFESLAAVVLGLVLALSATSLIAQQLTQAPDQQPPVQSPTQQQASQLAQQMAQQQQAQLLAELKDIEEPRLTGARLAPGWLALALTAFVLLLLLGVYIIHRRQRPRWRAAALVQLTHIRAQLETEGSIHIIPECSKLLRRSVLALESREAVSTLSGSEWLHALDRLHGSDKFTHGVGTLLGAAPYQRPVERKRSELESLLNLVEDFISTAQRSQESASVNTAAVSSAEVPSS